jgi:hypothetical protein
MLFPLGLSICFFIWEAKNRAGQKLETIGNRWATKREGIS